MLPGMFVGHETHPGRGSGSPWLCPGVSWSPGRLSLAGRTGITLVEDWLWTGHLGGRGLGRTLPSPCCVTLDKVFNLSESQKLVCRTRRITLISAGCGEGWRKVRAEAG